MALLGVDVQDDEVAVDKTFYDGAVRGRVLVAQEGDELAEAFATIGGVRIVHDVARPYVMPASLLQTEFDQNWYFKLAATLRGSPK